MRKAVITNRIYLDGVDDELKSTLVKTLTYRFEDSSNFDRYGGRKGAPSISKPPEVVRNYSIIRPGVMSIPSGRVDLIPEDYEIVDSRVATVAKFPDPLQEFELRESQKEVYDQISSDCIINAKVSWGKTFTALMIAHKFGLKTLVVVHTLALREQWIDEYKKLFGTSPSIIQPKGHDYSGPVTIANIQSLNSAMDKDPSLKTAFGLIILDEAHHVPATTFKKSIDKFNAKYKIGLTGTLERKDGKHIMFSDYFGTKVFKPARENSMHPTVMAIKSNITMPKLGQHGFSWANVVTKLCSMPEYQRLIVTIAKSMVQKGHQVLIVSDRVEFLEACAQATMPNSALVTSTKGDRKTIHQALLNRELDMLWGSVGIYKEGVSVNSLSCLILAVQTNNVPMLEQLIGRVTRLYDDKKLNPVIVDVLLKGPTAVEQANARTTHYAERGYELTVIEM